MILMFQQEVEEIALPQMSTWMPLRDPDALPPHNPCFCRGIDPLDK